MTEEQHREAFRDAYENGLTAAVERLAYRFWEGDGRVHGRDRIHYHRALFLLDPFAEWPPEDLIGEIPEAAAVWRGHEPNVPGNEPEPLCDDGVVVRFPTEARKAPSFTDLVQARHAAGLAKADAFNEVCGLWNETDPEYLKPEFDRIWRNAGKLRSKKSRKRLTA